MAKSLRELVLTKDNFEEFYAMLWSLEEESKSWVNNEYSDSVVEEQIRRKNFNCKRLKYITNLRNRDYYSTREMDLRRMLLHKIGKYELEEGEIFE